MTKEIELTAYGKSASADRDAVKDYNPYNIEMKKYLDSKVPKDLLTTVLSRNTAGN